MSAAEVSYEAELREKAARIVAKNDATVYVHEHGGDFDKMPADQQQLLIEAFLLLVDGDSRDVVEIMGEIEIERDERALAAHEDQP